MDWDKLLSYFALLVFLVWLVKRFFLDKKSDKKDEKNN